MTLPESPQTSPLSEASPSSLEEIFATSPLERTDAEWLATVVALRSMREKWKSDELNGAKRAAAPKKGPLKAAPKELSLDDLGL